MLLMIKLDKSDIETIRCGNNLAIKTGLLEIVFSPEAAQEFIQDVRQIGITGKEPKDDSEKDARDAAFLLGRTRAALIDLLDTVAADDLIPESVYCMKAARGILATEIGAPCTPPS